MQSPIIQPQAPTPFCNISMDAKGQWNMQTNVSDEPTIIGILSLMINSVAGRLAKSNQMIINPNRIETAVKEEIQKREVKPNGDAS